MPPGARFISLLDDNGLAVDGQRVSPDGLTVTMEQPIREIRPNEKLRPYRLQVEGRRAGKLEMRVEVTSVLSGAQPVVMTEDTKVNAN